MIAISIIMYPIFCHYNIQCDNEKLLKGLYLQWHIKKYCISLTFSFLEKCLFLCLFLLRKIQANMQYSCGYVLRFLNSVPYFPHSRLCSGDTNTPADGGEGEKGLLDVGKSAKLSAHSSVNSCSFYWGLSKIENCCIS